ncbi:hypothetical protein NL676_023824 [Syzygium grande]|nr:hypothetical protein NL676_023824 [Syzygium grande]
MRKSRRKSVLDKRLKRVWLPWSSRPLIRLSVSPCSWAARTCLILSDGSLVPFPDFQQIQVGPLEALEFVAYLAWLCGLEGGRGSAGVLLTWASLLQAAGDSTAEFLRRLDLRLVATTMRKQIFNVVTVMSLHFLPNHESFLRTKVHIFL